MRPRTLPLVLLLTAACRRTAPAAGGTPSPDLAAGPALAAAPAAQERRAALGQADPFPRPATLKLLARAARAQRRPAVALPLLREAVTVAPESAEARLVLARALAAAGEPAEGVRELQAALRLDLLGSWDRYQQDRAFAALRGSKDAVALEGWVAALRPEYAAGLGTGVVLVARTRPGRPATEGSQRLSLQQEAYHFDPDAGRFRRLTVSGGRVLAALRSPDGKLLSYLAVGKVGQGDVFLDAQAGVVDLQAPEPAGLFPLPNPTGHGAAALTEVRLGFGAQGQPLFQAALGEAGEVTYTIDSARTGLVRTEAEPDGPRVVAAPRSVHYEAGAGGAQRSESGTALLLPGGDLVTSTRPIAADSIQWAPGKGRLVYASRAEPCAALRDPSQRSELFLYELTAKRARRLDSGPGPLRALWLGEDLLAYDRGLGGRSAVRLVRLPGGAVQQLSAPYGAALHGLPLLACEEPLEWTPELPAAPPPAQPEDEEGEAAEEG